MTFRFGIDPAKIKIGPHLKVGGVGVWYCEMALVSKKKKNKINPHLLLSPYFLLFYLFKQIVKVPPVMSRNRDGMRNFVDNVQLLNRDLINLVEDVDARNIDTIALDCINQVICSSIAAQRYISIVHTVFSENSLDGVIIKVSQNGSTLTKKGANVEQNYKKIRS